jgi:hypothetical protein
LNTQALVEYNTDREDNGNASSSCCFRRVKSKVNGFILKHFSIQQVVIVLTPASFCAIAEVTWLAMYAPKSFWFVSLVQ